MKFQIDHDFGLLYARPSFRVGFISLLDWAGTLNVYNESATEERADSLATKSDWMFVGKDIRTAIKKLQDQKNE